MFYFDEGLRAEARVVAKAIPRTREEPDDAGGVLMILWRRREARPAEPKKKVNLRILELQAAKEILAEIFHARSADIEEMIQSRLEERSWAVEQMPASDGFWPVAFCPRE